MSVAASSPSGGWAGRLAGVLPAWLVRRQDDALPIREGTHLGTGRAVRLPGVDVALVALVLCLLAFSIVMVYSASIALPDSRKYAAYAPTHFLLRQALYMLVGLAAAWLTLQVPVAFWERYANHLFVFSLVLLVLVLIPHVGKVINGARRWLPLGLMNFQPSELAKLTIAMYAASYMVRKQEVRERFFKAVAPMVIALGVVGGLLLLEPDMGAFMIIAVIALGILFLGGVNGRMFLLSAAVLVGAFVLIIVTSEFRRQRIFAYLDPWNPLYASKTSYQLTHSLIAFGRGEWFGQGLGASIEKLNYLPEAQTDFLLAVIAEELGLVAVLVLIVAFFWLTARIITIGRRAVEFKQLYAGLMVQGIGLWIGAQAVVNMGVTMGLLPTKGFTLPLLSYGGSGLVLNLVALAMVLRVDRETRALMRGAER